MYNKIVVPKPLTYDEVSANYNRRREERKDIWMDFSNEPIEKALFLDIDGVLQPFTQYRFKYVNDDAVMEELYKKLEADFGVDYREFHQYDVAAAYYDWDKDAVNELKRVLDVTGAKIVLSSDWRTGLQTDYMPFLLRIYDLQKYLYGYTPIFLSGEYPKYENISRDRAVEILEYLRTHPHIKKWGAVDDMNLSNDLPNNFVMTDTKMTAEHADRCIEILGSFQSE